MSQPQQPKAAPTNNQNSLDEPRDPIEQILDDFYDGVYIEELPKAIAAINKTIMESLPKKKEVYVDPSENIQSANHAGYNQAISDMEQAITKKYGRADNE